MRRATFLGYFWFLPLFSGWILPLGWVSEGGMGQFGMISPRGVTLFRLGIWTGPFPIGDMLSSWGYGPAPFQLGIWSGPFGDMLSSWEYGPAPFQLGIWSGPFPVGDMDQPLCTSGYGPAPFQLGICFLVGNMDRPLSGWGYGPAPLHFGI